MQWVFSLPPITCVQTEVLDSLPNPSFQVTRDKNALWALNFILKWLMRVAELQKSVGKLTGSQT